MAAAGHGGLDPRQVKAREEFQRMREQLRRSLERTSDPAPWRERAPADLSGLRRGAERSIKLAYVRPRRIKWKRPAMIAGGAFAAGIVTALLVSVVMLRGPREVGAEPLVAAAPQEPAAASTLSPSLRPTSSAGVAAVELRPAAERDAAPAFAAVAGEPETFAALETAPAVVDEPVAPDTDEVDVAAIEIAPPVAEPEPEVVATAPEPAAPRVARRLEAPPPTSPGADPVAARINRIREAQALLADVGYPIGRADGDAGPQTLAAVAAFAEAHELSDTNIDDALLAALRAARAGALATPGARDAGDEVVARVSRVRDAQALLAALGYDPGRADGDPGPLTLEAASAFAGRHELEDSNLDEAFLALLREDTVRPR
jgi:peptidoglycan hydrolase-like protein with peptidoglycan-binding domain